MNIVFDFGGVLFQWEPHHFLARMLPAHAPTPEAARALAADFFQGHGGDWADFDRGSVEPAVLGERIAHRIGLDPALAHRVIAGVPQELTPIEGTVHLLRRLHAKGLPLYFLSNMPAPYAQHLDAQHRFLDLFGAGVYSCRVGLIKPDPQIYAHAVQAFGIDPAQTLFIDDLPANVQAARDAGWQAMQFRSPQQCEEELVGRGLL